MRLLRLILFAILTMASLFVIGSVDRIDAPVAAVSVCDDVGATIHAATTATGQALAEHGADLLRLGLAVAAIGIVAFAILQIDRTGPTGILARFRYMVANLAAEHGEVALRPTAEIRGNITEAAAKFNELRTLPADKRGDTYDADLRAARTDVLNLDVEFDVSHKAERYDLEAAAWEDAVRNPPRPESRGPEAAFAELRLPEMKTAGQRFTESEEYRAWADRHVTEAGFFEAEVRSHELRTLLDSTTDGNSPGVFLPQGQPIAPYVRQRRMFVRDVLAVQQTGLSNVPYLREVNAVTNETGATAVAEGVAKPEVTAEFEQDDAPVRKIAAWIPATTEIIEDAPTLRGYIDTRLAYMLAVREEQQVLDGAGTAPHIKGIMQFDDVQDQSEVTDDYPATIGQAIGKIENVDGFPNFVASNPLDFWLAVTSRHANDFDGEGTGAPNGAPSGIPNITWGLTPIRSRAMTAGTSLVGDGQMGATIFDRQDTVIRVGNQHSTYFTENKVAILAEKRLGLAVHAPHLFVQATVPTS